MNVLASSFGDGDVLLWMFEFFIFVIWFWLLVVVFGDLFRDHETSGGVKALWEGSQKTQTVMEYFGASFRSLKIPRSVLSLRPHQLHTSVSIPAALACRR